MTHYAYIIDCRDGSTEKVAVDHETLLLGARGAYQKAHEMCETRNQREGWARFVAIPERAFLVLTGKI